MEVVSPLMRRNVVCVLYNLALLLSNKGLLGIELCPHRLLPVIPMTFLFEFIELDTDSRRIGAHAGSRVAETCLCKIARLLVQTPVSPKRTAQEVGSGPAP